MSLLSVYLDGDNMMNINTNTITVSKKDVANENRDDANGAKLKVTVKDLKALYPRLFLRAKKRGSWPTLRGDMITGTVLEST